MWLWSLVFLTIAVLAVAVPLRARAGHGRSWPAIERGLVLAALVWAVGVAAYLAVAPFYAGVEASAMRGSPPVFAAPASRTLLEVDGSIALIAMLLPVALAALPLLRRASKTRLPLEIISAAFLILFVTIGGLSIGLFYAPSALLMLAAAVLAVAARRDT